MRIFNVLFRGSTLKQGLERSSNILRKIKSTAMPCFLCVLSVGASAPNLDTKDFSRKVLWNLKSFAKKVVFFEQSSLAHLSPKERCVLLPTFLIRKVGIFCENSEILNIYPCSLQEQK